MLVHPRLPQGSIVRLGQSFRFLTDLERLRQSAARVHARLSCMSRPAVLPHVLSYLQRITWLGALQPCVWGTAEEGLAPPPLIHLDTNLTTIKRANNTNGHWGVMAMWQARGAYVEK